MKTEHFFRALGKSFFFLVGAFMMACGEIIPDTPEPDPDPGPEPPIVDEKPAVIDLSNPETSGISVLRYDMVKGELEIDAEEGKEPKVGDYLFCGRTEVAPYGFMMKVGSVSEVSTRGIMKRFYLAAADITLYEFCLAAGITEPRWYSLIETEASFVDDGGNVIEPGVGDGPKLFTYQVPLEFEKNVKLNFKQEYTIPSLELYFDPSSVNVVTGCRAVIKNKEVLHAELKGSLLKAKGDLYKKYGVQEFIVRHTYELPLPVPVFITTQFKPSVPYELSLSGELDMDIINSTKYNRLEFYYSLLTGQMTPIHPDKGYFYQDLDFDEKRPSIEPDENTITAKLEGVASIGLDFEYSVGLYGSNWIDEDEVEKDKESFIKVSKLLSLGANAGYKLEYKSSLGIQGELQGLSHHKIKVVDENKLTSYVYGKLWTTVVKAEVEGIGIELGNCEVEVKLFKKEFFFPTFFRDWRKMAINPPSGQGFISVSATNCFPFKDWCFKESGYGFCLESFDGHDYWVFDATGYPLDQATGKINFDIPLSIDNLRRNVTYTVYPFSMITNFPFVEGDQMVCRKGVSFVISEDGELTTTTIDDIPGEVL